MIERIKKTGQWLSLYLAIVSFSIIIVINSTFIYKIFVKASHLEKLVGLSQTGLIADYKSLLSYFNYPWVNKLQMTLPSSYNGMEHYHDVKQLFQFNYACFLIFGFIAILFIRQMIKQKELWKLIRPFQMAATIPFLSVFLLFFNFEYYFILFHELMFRNNDWIFNPQLDPIILALPENFFMICFLLVFCLIELCFFLGMFIGKKEIKKSK
ncbi:TIGR01906 family membrane protein [Dellaglioa sp. BT-FLS60]